MSENLYYRVKVTPKSKREEITGTMDDGTIKLCVHAAPENGKANLSVQKVLAKHFDVKSSQIKIISGHTSQIKLIKVDYGS